jgi:hypothetical protein
LSGRQHKLGEYAVSDDILAEEVSFWQWLKNKVCESSRDFKLMPKKFVEVVAKDCFFAVIFYLLQKIFLLGAFICEIDDFVSEKRVLINGAVEIKANAVG